MFDALQIKFRSLAARVVVLIYGGNDAVVVFKTGGKDEGRTGVWLESSKQNVAYAPPILSLVSNLKIKERKSRKKV